MIQTLANALAERGYNTLTAVQEAVTKAELQEADLLVSAQTGSGKTVGFGLAIGPTLLGEAETLGPAGAPLALVVAPTRELAFQVMRELGWLYAGAGARVASCVGGMDMRDERRALERGAHIVVGTPGRLRDHIQRGSLDLSGIRAVVLDEADEMLDLGFREDLEFMLGEAPEDRRTLMFSATVPPQIAKLAEQFQRDAVRVTTLSGTSQHADIAYQALRVAQIDAENAIINVLRYHDAENALVFANTRATVNRLTARFSNRGFAVVALSGELSQTERTHALQAMRDGRAQVCVATDVAARGIDLPNLDLVIHAELPSNDEGLLHRSGRTGRAGRKGTSVLIVTPKIARKAERLLSSAGVEAEWTTAPTADEILRRDEERLLADPAWAEETNEEQEAFAAKLLARHAPERIAAAYLRLYRSRQSAPEELSPPDARPAQKARRSFEPGAWFALSVGRDDRAEPRWLLPLICRAGDVDKDAIGAIRVQQAETLVEISAENLSRFLAALDDKVEIEKGIRIRRLEGEPDVSTAPPAAEPTVTPMPPLQPDRPAVAAPEPKPKPRSAPPKAPPSPSAEVSKDRGAPAARRSKPRHKTPVGDRNSDRPGTGPGRAGARPGGASAESGGKRTGASAGKKTDSGRERPDKSKFVRRRAAGKPAAGSSDASDTSQRFTPPGKAGTRNGSSKARTQKPSRSNDGSGPPRRGKR
ncbi:DEAD/DEAH box helicase [Roseitranquillus sediminis]|uniref:DEAD/DEAH box helicase n=1 Tax=Roseitranquillus sediminis TaxID=2809051 RepID=UPI001D0C9516|nr:DEAD/DEAH box helicase [Roseitranquillus sediminis]MBM9594472.1 DEAD/DEAH box helicase [Roseitranquillus sediminis]